MTTYALDNTTAELDRLVHQARYFGDLTAHVLHLAGVATGMRVLDVGCGPGDVTFLLSRIVGAEGAVIGIDTDARAVAGARSRAEAVAATNTTFLHADAHTVDLDQPVDAVVGRLVLMHLPDPPAALRHLRDVLVPGGLVVFHEFDLAGSGTEPACPLFDTTLERLRETFRRVGVDPRAGLRLRRWFLQAGLPEPEMTLGARVEGGPAAGAYAQLTAVTRSLLVPMEQTGVATAAEVDVDTLEARLRAELVASDAVGVSPLFVGAWAHDTDGGGRR